MYNGPADRIRRAHRANPGLSPKEIADNLNAEKNVSVAYHPYGRTQAHQINPKYVSKILRRDGVAAKFKTGPKPEARKKKGPTDEAQKPHARKQRPKARKAAKNVRTSRAQKKQPRKRRAVSARTR